MQRAAEYQAQYLAQKETLAGAQEDSQLKEEVLSKVGGLGFRV